MNANWLFILTNQTMTKSLILVFLLCTAIVCQSGNNCGTFFGGDLLQSGKNAIVRGAMKDPPNYVYESPVNFKIPDSGVEIAITTATIGDYNPLPTYGYNYFIDASRKSPTSNYIVYQLLMNNDLSWTSIQLSFLVSARSDLAIGNIEFPIDTWGSANSNVYTVNVPIAKALPKYNYKSAVFISGFSTTDSQFSLIVNKKVFDYDAKNLAVSFFSSANPAVLTLTLTYIVYPEVHPILVISYALVPQADIGAYQISGPVNFQPNKRIQYNEWRVESRSLACEGNECAGNTCILRESCVSKNGNIWESKCIFCAPGIVFSNGFCAGKCGANQLYISRACICLKGFTRAGKDCVQIEQKKCGTNQVWNEAQKLCVCNSGFFNRNNECIQCPAGSDVTPDGKSCFCNSVDKVYDDKSNTCKNRCYENQRWNINKCECFTNYCYWNQGCRKCPDNAVASADQLVCNCNSDRAYHDPETNVCVECAAGLILNKAKSACVCLDGFALKGGVCAPLCSDSEIYNPKTKGCDCKLGLTRNNAGICGCANGYVLVKDTCLRNCQDPEVFDVLTGNCVCKTGFVRGGAGNVCGPRCPPGENWDGNNCVCADGQARYGSCRVCPAGTLPNSFRTRCICTDPNQIFQGDKFSCLTCGPHSSPTTDLSNCICNPGYIVSGSNCILNCGLNEQPNNDAGRCECIFGYKRVDTKCVPRCNANQQWNGNQCICKPGFGLFKGVCTACPENSSANKDRTSCLCDIPNFIFNPVAFSCDACPPYSRNNADDTQCLCDQGYEKKGDYCSPICQVGEELNTKTNTCDCKYGFIRLGPICTERCGLNQEWDGSKCICKENHMFSTGVCRPCPDITGTNPKRTTCICKDPKQIYDITKGVCVPLTPNCVMNDDFTGCNCYPGYKKDQGACVNTCPTGATPDATGNCVCGGGFYLEGGVCKKPVQCPPRSTWNSKTFVCDCDVSGEFLIDNICQKCGDNSFYSAANKRCLCSTGFFYIGAECRVCDPHTKFNGTDCVCNLGYFGNRDKCTKCHDSCATCSGPEANNCQTCSDVSLILQNGYCSKNTPCDPGFYLDDSSCQKCTDNCIICDNVFQCQQCSLGYQIEKLNIQDQQIETCSQICGDGIRYQAECDDGNANNGDGCSSECTIETGWSCANGSTLQKSKCVKYIPEESILTSKGVVNLGDRVVQSVRASYLPKCLTENECAKCFKSLKVNVVDANVPILVKVSFVAFSQYQFLIEYNFQGLFVTSKFKTVVRFSEEFKGCLNDEDFSQQIELLVDPAFLAKVDVADTLDITQITPGATPNVVVPAAANGILGIKP